MEMLRRLFVVPLADNSHGKSRLVNALLAQGLGQRSPGRKGRRLLRTPWGRNIDALVYVRSFQETEKSAYPGVTDALRHDDDAWYSRDLIVMPSHLEVEDVVQMVQAAHENGFDAIGAAILLDNIEHPQYAECWQAQWDERWTIPNPRRDTGWEDQVDALGRDLWAWISRATLGG